MIRSLTQRLFSPRLAPGVLVLAAVGVLGAAYIFQYGFGYLPCELCLYQRIPWWLVLFAGVGGFFALRISRLAESLLLIPAGLILLGGAGLAAYHAGVEWHWWPGPSSCSGEALPNDLEALKQALLTSPVVRCDEVQWRLFGLSMAGYNVLLSLGLGLYALFMARMAIQRKQSDII